MPAPLSRRAFSLLTAGLGASLLLAVRPAAAKSAGLSQRIMELRQFRTAPFPYHGKVPDTGLDFMDVNSAGRLGHRSNRGGIYWEDATYSDNRVLLALPKGFDLARKFVIVVYFHGNSATLERDVIGRQAVVDQLEDSGLNAVLVVPQLAVDALDSSAGRFWLEGAFKQFMAEAAQQLGRIAGRAEARRAFEAAPIVLVAYSGGYDPAAYALAVGGLRDRIRGVLLLDAAFGESEAFADWIVTNRRSAFFFSAFSASSKPGNLEIERLLQSRKLAVEQDVPKQLKAATVGFYEAEDDVAHEDFVTDAWEHWPLRSLLSRIAGYTR